MFIVTNREVFNNKNGFAQFGQKLNPKGSLELRLVEVSGRPGNWRVSVLPDKATKTMRKRAGLPAKGEHYASHYAAARLLKRSEDTGKARDILFFVHGFNNDVESVVERAYQLEQEYDVEVVAFSWPANGGGVKGVASYKSDKRDALASIGALDRCIQRIGDFLHAANAANHAEIRKRALKKFGDDAERREAFIAEAMEKRCPVRVSMMLHSMGNYLFKRLLTSSIYHARELVFDNVIMVAADTNNLNHAEWADKIQCRNRIFVTINENDSALRASRMKLGSLQLARLGHYIYSLDSDRATYVDFTRAEGVGTSHAYFEGAPIENIHVRTFFQAALHGMRAEEGIEYDASRNLYRVQG